MVLLAERSSRIRARMRQAAGWCELRASPAEQVSWDSRQTADERARAVKWYESGPGQLDRPLPVKSVIMILW